MTPQTYDFPPMTRGDSETLEIGLRDQDVFTRRITPSLKPGDVVRWIVALPDGAELVKSTADASLGLDLRISLVTWSLSSDDWTKLGGGGSFPYKVRVTRSTGEVETYLKGALTVEA